MKMIKVKSSNIRSVGYSANLFQLVVEFKVTDRSKVKVFLYEDVSPSEYEALLNAGSIGRHFGVHIKNAKEGRPINCTVADGDNGEELHVKGKSKPTTSPWIGVDDEMPNPEFDFVLAYADGAMSTITYSLEHGFHESYPIATQLVISDITHWMPLPEPPTT